MHRGVARWLPLCPHRLRCPSHLCPPSPHLKAVCYRSAKDPLIPRICSVFTASSAASLKFCVPLSGEWRPPEGLLVDVTQNYKAAFYSCAAGMGLGVIFLGFVRPSKTGQLCSRRKNRQNNPIVEQVCKDKLEEILEVDNQDIKS